MATTSPQSFTLELQQCCDDVVSFLAGEANEHNLALSKSAIKDAMSKGALWRASNGKPRRLRRKSAPLKAGDVLHFYFDPVQLALNPLAPTLVEDCGAFSVWDKPCGMPMLGSKWCDHTALERWVSVNHLAGGASYIVHRLDRWASGVVVIAHSKKAAAELAAQFANRSTRKIYRALSAGHLEESLPKTIEIPVEGKRALTIIHQIKPATSLLNYSDAQNVDADSQARLFRSQSVSELLIEIKTGRKHQIRCHCSEIGLPLLGDRRYGSNRDCQHANHKYGDDFDLQLRATSLSLIYEGRQYQWESPNGQIR